jgi:subtilisin family serine protease
METTTQEDTNMTARTPIFLAALTAVLVALATAVSTAQAGTRPAVPSGSAGISAGRLATRFASLDAAVAAGVLDASVARQLLTRGSADAIVTFDQSGIVERAARLAGHGRGRASRLLSSIRPAFRTQKAHALRGIAGLSVVHRLDNLALSHVRFTSPAALLATANGTGVTGIRVNRTYRLRLKESLPLIHQPEVAAAGKTGAGTYVAVLDTGIDYTRSAFGTCTAPGAPSTCRVAAAWDQAPDDGSLDDHGHGTNVSGIVAGVAPGTRLVVADVFVKHGRAMGTSDALVEAAINKVVELKRGGLNIRAINLSLGDTSYHTSSCGKSSYAQSFRLARSVGILPVVAAGNDAYVNGKFHRGLGDPACVPGAISVGAIYDGNLGSADWRDCVDRKTAAGKITCFSQTGKGLTLLAPGSEITAAEVTESGTSQATPHVAGAIAVLAAQNPTATVDQIQSVLHKTGPLVRDRRTKASFHRLDLAAAVAAIGGTPAPPPPPPPPPPPADRTPPSISAPDQTIPAAGWMLGSGGATPLTVTWQGSDASGIAAYRAQVSVDGGAFSDLTLASPTSTSVTLNNLQPGSTYQFAVSAKDGAGNQSGWAYGPKLTLDVQQETAARYSTSDWQLLSWAQDLGGYQAATTTAGAYVTFDFTGRQVAWVAPSSSVNGAARVWLDSTDLGTFDEYSASTAARKIQVSVKTSYGPHRLTIQAAGTAGHAQIDVDAFAVLR